jgi:RING-like zinc finger
MTPAQIEFALIDALTKITHHHHVDLEGYQILREFSSSPSKGSRKGLCMEAVAPERHIPWHLQSFQPAFFFPLPYIALLYEEPVRAQISHEAQDLRRRLQEVEEAVSKEVSDRRRISPTDVLEANDTADSGVHVSGEKEEQTNFICSICLEPFCREDPLSIEALPCAHVFHAECIKRQEQTSLQRCCSLCKFEYA